MNEADLFSEIEQWMTAEPTPGLEKGTFTTPVFMKRYHMGRDRARRMLSKWVAEGKIKPDRISFVNDWGWQQRIAGYRFLNGEDKDVSRTTTNT